MKQLGDELELCCGRPLFLSGHVDEAKIQVAKLESAINKSGAKTLVTSCPVCYNMFLKHYQLKIQVVHHSELIHQWIKEKRIKVRSSGKSFVYHDPCELGRANGFFEMPREVLGNLGLVLKSGYEKEASLCCGGSLADFTLTNAERKQTAAYAMDELTAKHPDYVVTACPMCKKSLNETRKGVVMDIAEVTNEMVIPYSQTELFSKVIANGEPKSVGEEVEVM
jgi:Fe-S oxidoreductase